MANKKQGGYNGQIKMANKKAGYTMVKKSIKNDRVREMVK